MTAERAFLHFLAQSDYRRPMIEWAMDRLRAGSECPSTTLLAGADYEPDDEVVRLFRLAAKEEGIHLPDEAGELQWREIWICDEIVSGRIEPQTGLSALYRIWVESQFDPRFSTWLYLSDSVELLEDGYGGLEPFHEMKLEDLDTTILSEASLILNGVSPHGLTGDLRGRHSVTKQVEIDDDLASARRSGQRRGVDEQKSSDPKKRPILGYFASSIIGTMLAFPSSAVILQFAFGVTRVDSASLWLLSGAADLMMGFLCLPAFLLAHGASYVALKNADTTSWRATRSVVQGIIFFWIVLILVWRWQVGGSVTKGY